MLAAAGGGVRVIMDETDAIDRLRTREALSAAIAGHRLRLVRSARDNAVWTMASDKVADGVNREFAHEWWGVYTDGESGRDATLVVDGNGQALITFAQGREVNGAEAERLLALARPVITGLADRRDQAAGRLIVSPQGVALVSAANIIPYPADRTLGRMARPVRRLVFIAEMHGALLKSVNEGVKVAGLELRWGGAGRDTLALGEVGGRRVELAWTPRALGPRAVERAVAYLGPGLAIALALLALTARASLRTTAALDKLAHTDSLTGLANRPAFLGELNARLARGQMVAVGIADLNGFKAVNDTHGHLAGDELLRSVAKELRAAAPVHGFIARLGGDEFAFLTPDLLCAERLARDFRDRLQRPLSAGCVMARVGASIGIAEGGPANTARDIIALADARLYRDKEGDPRAAPVGTRLHATLVSGGG